MSTSSIARSASGNQLASGAQVWSWTFPGAPICINLSRNLIARLQNDLDTRTRALGDSGREIGGLLFGHPRGDDSIVVVEDYAWLPSEPTQSGSYGLNTAELERMRAERAGRSSVVIGYFRTDFGANLEVRDAEMDLIGRQFSKSTDVVLLICSSRPHTGGFFFWMGEGVMSPFSLMDFPLDVTRLPFHDDPDAAAPPSFSNSSAPVPELAAAAPLVAPPAHEPEQDLMTWPVLEPAPFKTAAPTVVRMPSKQAPVPAALVPPTTPVITIAQPSGKKIPPPAPSTENAVRDNAARESAPRENTALENPARENPAPTTAIAPRAKSVWLTVAWTLALLIGLCLAAGVIVLAFRGEPLSLASASAAIASKPQPAPAFPLQLTVEAQGTGLNIRWNAQSSAAAQAREGQLTVTETGKAPVVIPLTAEQLTIGHIYFQSSAERAEVQLATSDGAGKISRESVLALSSVPQPPAPLIASVPQPRPAAGASQASDLSTRPAPLPVRKVESIPIPTRNVSAAVEGAEALRVQRSPARAFTAPSLNRAPSRVAVIDQPAVAASPAAPVPVPLSIGVLNTRVAPPPSTSIGTVASAAAPQQTPPQQITPRQIRVTSSLQAARLVRKVAPIYPQVAIAGRVQGVVRFTAVIAKDGTIRDLKPMAGPSILANAATAAVAQWTYQPTLLNGQPVEVVTEIDVNFTLSQ